MEEETGADKKVLKDHTSDTALEYGKNHDIVCGISELCTCLALLSNPIKDVVLVSANHSAGNVPCFPICDYSNPITEELLFAYYD